MKEALIFLLPPLCMCLMLAGIHCYLGLHVISRKVIFVDLSLAQVASFGATCALIWNEDHHSLSNYFISLGATLVAAAFFSLARRFEKEISQEAIIGIVYALASAAVILVIDRLAHGAEHLKEALVGQILWVTWGQVIKTAIIYSFVGIVHYIFRKPLLKASADEKGNTHWKWDFLFYSLFGVVITSSTQIAGVLLVFSYLIVPAILGFHYFKTTRARLLFGWALGSAVSIVGLILSYHWDVPVGALIVVLFTILPISLLLWRGGLRISAR